MDLVWRGLDRLRVAVFGPPQARDICHETGDIDGDLCAILQSETQSRAEVAVEPIPLWSFEKDKVAFYLKNVLTAQECEAIILATERLGYNPSLVDVGGDKVHMPDFRNSHGCLVKSIPTADEIWKRIQAHVPQVFNGRTAIGLHERLQFLRYHSGQHFDAHRDGGAERSNGEKSFLSVQIYLNQGFQGGTTRFLFSDEDHPFHDVVPETGAVLVFQHSILHQGSEVIEGSKYALRTNVMYRECGAAARCDSQGVEP